jgi:hypothetical protein
MAAQATDADRNTIISKITGTALLTLAIVFATPIIARRTCT